MKIKYFLVYTMNAEMHEILDFMRPEEIDKDDVFISFVTIPFEKITDINKTILNLLENNESNNIFLIDREEDICHIYKSDMSIADFKQIILKMFEPAFKTVTKEDLVLSRLNDLREIMPFAVYDKMLLN